MMKTMKHIVLHKTCTFDIGNQPVAGKIAVSQVVINRTNHMNYPSTICGVVYDANIEKTGKVILFQSDINVSSLGFVMVSQMTQRIQKHGYNV